MPFLDFIENLQNKPREYRFRVFVGVMICAVFIVIVIFGFSVKRVLRVQTLENSEFMEDKISKNLPSIKESIASSIMEIFNFKKGVEEELANINDKNSPEAGGYRLPRTE